MPSFHSFWLALSLIVLAVLELVPNASAQERKGEAVFNVVEGETTIQSIKPAGTMVKKGELVCELESFPVRARLERQEQTTKVAEGPYKSAKLAREVAEVAVTAYLEGEYKQQLQSVANEIELAQVGVKQAEQKVAAAKRLVEKKLRPKSDEEAEELRLKRAKLAVEKAEAKKYTLEKYTKAKNIKERQGAVEKARGDELTAQANLAREQAAEEQLRKQIEACKLLAPRNGRLVYATPIEEGAEVRKGQLLFRVVPE